MIDLKAINHLAGQGYININSHPDFPLRIYNYLPKTQFENLWTPETIICRGLILDEGGNIVGRPLDKFFNLGQHKSVGVELPKEKNWTVYEKVDGVFFILTKWREHLITATRGSFTSKWANIGQEVLREKYPNLSVEKGKTYCFELICPESRGEHLTVVNYGQEKELVLLAIRETATGRDLPLEDIGPPVVETYNDIDDWMALKDAEEQENREGFVVKWPSGFRIKIKLDWYNRLHKIISRTTEKAVWEALRDNTPMDDILEDVPDEFLHWFKHTRDALRGQYRKVERICKQQFRDFESRKEAALYFTGRCDYPAVLFRMLDGKNYSDLIWKIVRPER